MSEGISDEEIELLKAVRMRLREAVLGYGGLSIDCAKDFCLRLSKMIGERYEFDTGVSFPISDEE